MNARHISSFSIATVAALTFAGCAGGSAAIAPQPGAGAQSTAYVPQSSGVAASAAVAGALPAPLPEPIVSFGKRGPSPNLTAPIIDDSGSYANGQIILATNTTTSNGYGIEGITDGPGAGIYGHAAYAGSSPSYGVYGFGSSGTGVYGYSSQSGRGVLGSSVSGDGVEGESANYSGYGGYFTNTSANGRALDATSNGDAIDASSVNGDAIYGTANAEGRTGVRGDLSNKAAYGWAVIGDDNSSVGGVGVYGESTSGYGVLADSYSATSPALYVDSETGGPLITAAFFNTGAMSLDALGNMILAGNLIVDGKISSSNGSVGNCGGGCKLPALSDAAGRAQIETVGSAQLASGSAYVKIPSAFANELDPATTYDVFVTPDGDSAGWLYVSGKTTSGFTVRESHRGTSSIAFDYRIVGTQRAVALPRPLRVAKPAILRR